MKDAIKAILRGPVGVTLVSLFLRLVNATSRHVYEPRDMARKFGKTGPAIYATWHGQNFIFPFRFSRGSGPTSLFANHGDGQMVSEVMRKLGVGVIVGSGSPGKTDPSKGGARAFLQMLRALKDGKTVTLTADMPKIAREVGPGIVLLARKSGVPIIPVAMTTSRRKITRTWDKVQLNLPFSRMVFVEGPPITVPQDDTPLELYQAQLCEALEKAQSRAFELADS